MFQIIAIFFFLMIIIAIAQIIDMIIKIAWCIIEHLLVGLCCVALGIVEGVVSTIKSVPKVFIRLNREATHSTGFIDYLRKLLFFKAIGYICDDRVNFIDIREIARNSKNNVYVTSSYYDSCFEFGRGIICTIVGVLLGLSTSIIRLSIVSAIYIGSYLILLPKGVQSSVKRYLQVIEFKSLLGTYFEVFNEYTWLNTLDTREAYLLLPIKKQALRFNMVLHQVVTDTVLCMIHALLFIAVLPINLSFFLIVKLGYVLKRKFVKYSTVCPSCYEEMAVPNSVCPQCNEVHKKMWPHFTYVLYKKCSCGQKMWVDSWRKRQNTLGRCSCCGTNLLKMDYVPIHIPVIGNGQVGKTDFIYGVLENYQETLAFDQVQLSEYVSHLKKMKAKDRKIGRQDTHRDDFCMYFKKGKNAARMVFIHELSSVTSLDTNQLGHVKWLSKSKGLIMFLDLEREGQGTAQILDLFLIYMHKYCALKPTEHISQPCLFILRIKGDQLSDRTLSGEVLLQKMGYHNLLTKIQNKFKHYQFIIQPDYKWDKEQRRTLDERENAFKWLIEKSK